MPNEKCSFTIQRKLESFFSHGKIQSSANGQYLLCCCSSKVNFFSIETGNVDYHIEHNDEIELTGFCLSPGDKILITSNKEAILRQWSLIDRSLVRTWKSEHKGPIISLAFDASQTLLASGSADSTVKVWDLEKQYCTNLLRGHQGVVSMVKFNPTDSYKLFTTCDDYIIRCFNLKNHSCLFELCHHHSLITSIQFTTDAKHLFSCSRDTIVVKWDLEKLTKQSFAVYESVECLLLLKEDDQLPFERNVNEEYFMIGGSNGTLSFWSVTKGTCEFSLSKPGVHKEEKLRGGEVEEGGSNNNNLSTILQLEMAGENIFTITAESIIAIYDRNDFFVIKQFIGQIEQVTDVKFVGSGKEDTHLIVCTNSSSLKLFDLNSMSFKNFTAHSDIILCVDIARLYKSSYVVTGSKDNTIVLWKFSNDAGLQMLCRGEGHTHNVTSISFLHLTTDDQSDSIFIVSGSADKTIKLWKSSNQNSVSSNKNKKISINPIIDLEEKVEERVIQAKLTVKAHEKDINSVAVSPDHKIIATASEDKTAKLWNRDDLSPSGTLKGHKKSVWCVVFSQIDRIVATSSADSTIKLWDIASHNCIKMFEGHESSVLRVQFISRGMQLISSGSDGLIKLWRIRTNECVKTIDAHEDKIWCLHLDATEQILATAAGDILCIWKDTTEEEITQQNKTQKDIKLQEQELSNLLHLGKYVDALKLTIVLNQPSRALNIIRKLMSLSELEHQKALLDLQNDQIECLLSFCLTWNQNARNCHAAQFVLNFVLRHFQPNQLLSLPSIQTLIEGFTPYTERHLNRISQLHVKSSFLTYLCSSSQGSIKIDDMEESHENSIMDVAE